MTSTTRSARLLVAETTLHELDALRAPLEAAGHLLKVASETDEALRSLDAEPVDVVLLESQLARANDFELLTEIVSRGDAPSVLVVTNDADVSTAVEAMRHGAEHFLELPLSGAALEHAIQSTLRNRARETSQTAPQPDQTNPHDCLIGHSPAMKRVMNQLERAASASKVTTLILGESGTGKELVAKAIHARSDRADQPFIAINCAALTEGLLEAELFGYEGGAFTGASPKGRKGLFAAAEGGTLFLDEIGELAISLQAKLLRVLQEGSYRRVGSAVDVATNVRIMSSTNRDLESSISEGRFREDLFYRLNVLSIQVPPLRERAEDIPTLAVQILEEVRQGFDHEIAGFTESAMRRLVSYGWPGNVRELRNTIERSALMIESGRIQPKHLGLATQLAPALPAAEEDLSLQALEKAHISRVIRETDGNRSQAARLLGVNRTTLYNKLRRYGLSASAG